MSGPGVNAGAFVLREGRWMIIACHPSDARELMFPFIFFSEN